MSCPRTSVCLSPLPASQASRTPRILLGGQHQPTLLRHLEGLSRRKGQARAFLIQFADDAFIQPVARNEAHRQPS